MASATSHDSFPMPSLNTREPLEDFTSWMIETVIPFPHGGTANGVSEKAWPLRAAHLGDIEGDV